jgi:serine/threonine protein kinase
VAIKKFKGQIDNDDKIRAISKREMKMLKQCSHPNIVHLRNAFKRNGKLFLVFEYVEQNLLEILEEKPQGLNVRFTALSKIRSKRRSESICISSSKESTTSTK